MNRRGTGIVEALVSATLTALLIVAALGALSVMQRSTGRFASRALSEQVLRGVTQLLRSELGDVAPSAGEIVSITPASITYRSVRATGLACGSSGGRVQVFASSWVSLRQPAADRDSLVLLGQPVDTESVVASLGPTVMGFCPDGVASMSLPYVAASPDPMTAGRYPAPLLVSEVMEIRGYESGGEWWVGVRSVSSGEVIQPAHGPIGDGGLRITAHDSTGTVTSVPSLISHLLFMVKVPSGDSTVIHLDVTRGTWR